MNVELIGVGLVLLGVGGRVGWLLACRRVLEDTQAIQETLTKAMVDVAQFEKDVEAERENTKAIVLRLLEEINRLSAETK